MIKRYKMNVEDIKLSEFGIGTYFYLDFMKKFAAIFFLMTLIMIPVM
jgi:hypothetical protein